MWQLIVIGNSETLSKHRFYAGLFEYFKEKGMVVDAGVEEEGPSEKVDDRP